MMYSGGKTSGREDKAWPICGRRSMHTARLRGLAAAAVTGPRRSLTHKPPNAPDVSTQKDRTQAK